MWLSLLLIVVGIALVLFFAGRLVQGTVGIARGFGVSAFLVSVIFLGFDPENLGVGAVGAYERAHGIALGTIVGSAMVAVALAFGITALIAPLHFEQAPRRILIVPILAVLLIAGLAWDDSSPDSMESFCLSPMLRLSSSSSGSIGAASTSAALDSARRCQKD